MKSKPVTRRSVLAALPAGGAVVAQLVTGPAAAEPQPAMKAALESLMAAKTNLELASRDKGGHRSKALVFIKRAIEEVELGIKYDNTH